MNRILKLEQAALLIACYIASIQLGHSAMDRVFGYGLKYTTGFQDTHLGKIGKAKSQLTDLKGSK